MKLYSILLGWIGILTKSCVSPQVFYGSRRLAGRGDGTASNREKQMMSDSRRLVRPGAVVNGAQRKRPHIRIANLSDGQRIASKSAVLDRFEPYEGKLSRTVLSRGA